MNDHNPPILNLDELELEPWRHGERFEASLGAIGRRIGARKLGCRLVVLPPGKTAWPFHAHHVNEEMFLILEGKGCLRLGTERHPLRAGDVIAIPPGPDHPHQIINDGDAPLRYLCFSTMEEPEIVEMPDSDKIGILAGSPPGGDKGRRTLTLYLPRRAAQDYWSGEESD